MVLAALTADRRTTHRTDPEPSPDAHLDTDEIGETSDRKPNDAWRDPVETVSCDTCAVVKTGARAVVLRELLTKIGLRPNTTGPSLPRLTTLPADHASRIMDLFRTLGGTMSSPPLRPGPWDLICKADVVVELDEELHFNRYRRMTLEPDWTKSLPWRSRYLSFSTDREQACVAAATWGQRWTRASSESLFGAADAPGEFVANGAPRWKQRALYDAMKDTAALADDRIRLVRLATYDEIGGVRLGAALERRAMVDVDALRELVEQRMTR